jgi:hypothetical protein
MQGPNHVIGSTEFSIQPGEDAETTPGVYGRALADYLVTQIQGRGVDVERVIPEDFGYCIMVRRKSMRVRISKLVVGWTRLRSSKPAVGGA